MNLTQTSQPSCLSPAALCYTYPNIALCHTTGLDAHLIVSLIKLSHFVMCRNQILALHDERLLLLLIYQLVNKQKTKVHVLSVKAGAYHFGCLSISTGQEEVLFLTD